jgi:hypothetical protein
VREDVREQQAMGVDDGAPGLPDAAGGSEIPRRQAAEDGGDHVIRQGSCLIHGFRRLDPGIEAS